MATTEKNEKILQLNKTTHGYLIKNTENPETRLYIDTTFSQHVIKIIPQFVDLLLYRFNYAKLLGFNNFFELQINNCMYKDTKTIIEKIKEITIILRDKYLTDSLYKKNITDVIYEHENERKKLIKKIGNFNVLSYIIFLFKTIEELFDISFKPIELSVWDKSVEIFEIINNNKTIGFLFLDLIFRKHKINKSICLCFSPKGFYPFNKKTMNYPKICIFSNLKNPSSVTFKDIIDISHEFGHLIHYVFKKSKYCVLNNIQNELDFIEIPALLLESIICSKKNIESILRFEKIFSNNDKPLSLVADIINLKQIGFGFNLLQKCIISIFDQYIHSSDEFIKLLLNDKNNIIKNFNGIFKLLHKNAIDTNINSISPSTLITLTNGNEGLTHCPIISHMLSVNLLDLFLNNKNFRNFFKNNVLSNFHENSFELLFHFENKQIIDTNLSLLNVNFNKSKKNLSEDSFDLNDDTLTTEHFINYPNIVNKIMD